MTSIFEVACKSNQHEKWKHCALWSCLKWLIFFVNFDCNSEEPPQVFIYKIDDSCIRSVSAGSSSRNWQYLVHYAMKVMIHIYSDIMDFITIFCLCQTYSIASWPPCLTVSLFLILQPLLFCSYWCLIHCLIILHFKTMI